MKKNLIVHYVKKCKSIGPIIRDIDDNGSVTLVLYGHKENKRYCYGVLRIDDQNLLIVKRLTKYRFYGRRFKFNIPFQESNYGYMCGVFHTNEKYKSSHHLNFRKCNYSRVHVFPMQYNFIFGSCRFFPNFDGHGFLVNKSDQPFKNIAKMIDKYQISTLFIIGDSVYMDIVEWLPIRLKSRKKINKIHITARTSSGFRKVGSMVEIKEIPDDHEYRDNGTPAHYFKDKKAYRNCIDAINAFEISSGPYPKGTHVNYWEYLERQGIPFFMLDSRYERWQDEKNNPRIMSEAQFTLLKEKMLENKDKDLPFIIFSPTPFALQSGNDDLFSSSKIDQKLIIEFIIENEIKNVFILTGDAHASVSTRFKIYKHGIYTGFDIVEILCSGIYQYAHDSPKNFKNELLIDEYHLHSTMDLKTLQKNVITSNNFCLIEIDKRNKILKCSYFKSSGKFIRKIKYRF